MQAEGPPYDNVDVREPSQLSRTFSLNLHLLSPDRLLVYNITNKGLVYTKTAIF